MKIALHDKIRLEIGVSDHFVDPTVRAILAAGRTGEVGDGKIFVLPVEKVYRIRTGEEDQRAVTPVSAAEETGGTDRPAAPLVAGAEEDGVHHGLVERAPPAAEERIVREHDEVSAADRFMDEEGRALEQALGVVRP